MGVGREKRNTLESSEKLELHTLACTHTHRGFCHLWDIEASLSVTASEIKSPPNPRPGRLGSFAVLDLRDRHGLESQTAESFLSPHQHLGRGSASQSAGRFGEHFIILGSHNVCLNSGWPQADFQTGTALRQVLRKWGRVKPAPVPEAGAGVEEPRAPGRAPSPRVPLRHPPVHRERQAGAVGACGLPKPRTPPLTGCVIYLPEPEFLISSLSKWKNILWSLWHSAWDVVSTQ